MTTVAEVVDQAYRDDTGRAVATLIRVTRDFDLAEEAWQEACEQALRTWPQRGVPRDPTAWLIFVGRNSGIDQVRRLSKQTELPDEEKLSDLGDREADIVERLDNADYRDDEKLGASP